MLPAKCVAGFCLVIIFQSSFAETIEENKQELDEEFLEILGSIEEEDDWFELFLSTIDEVEEEQLSETNYE